MAATGVHLFWHDSAWVSRVQAKCGRPMRCACCQDLDSHSSFSISLCPQPECGISDPVLIHAASTVKVPSDTQILYESWDQECQDDAVYCWSTLRAERVAGKYWLYGVRIRYEGRNCVPPALLDNVIVATHTYAHPGIHKTHQLLDRKYIVHCWEQRHTQKDPYQKPKERITEILTSCQVCHSVRGRKGLQPEQLISYPVPEYPSSSIAVNFTKPGHVQTNGQSSESVFVVVCRFTGYVAAFPCSEHVTSAELASLFST